MTMTIKWNRRVRFLRHIERLLEGAANSIQNFRVGVQLKQIEEAKRLNDDAGVTA